MTPERHAQIDGAAIVRHGLRPTMMKYGLKMPPSTVTLTTDEKAEILQESLTKNMPDIEAAWAQVTIAMKKAMAPIHRLMQHAQQAQWEDFPLAGPPEGGDSE